MQEHAARSRARREIRTSGCANPLISVLPLRGIILLVSMIIFAEGLVRGNDGIMETNANKTA